MKENNDSKESKIDYDLILEKMNNILQLTLYKPYEIGVYIRLSKEDSNLKNESESVGNQKRVIIDFLKSKKFTEEMISNIVFYIDDGKSGVNFDRPAWSNLIKDIEKGNIKVLITKDTSRFGRDNAGCNELIDNYFPSKNIRYISVLEGIDTAIDNNISNDYMPFNFLMNAQYSKNLSRNIKRIFYTKQTQGLFLGSYAPYGYKKDPENRHKLIIDEPAATIIRRMANYILEDRIGTTRIANILTQEGIPIPSVYKKDSRSLKIEGNGIWNNGTIKKILQSEVLIGSIVQNVYSKYSLKSKRIKKNPKEKWIIVENVHEPILDKDTFYRIQEIFKQNYRCPVESKKQLLSGLLVCKECQHGLGINSRERKTGVKQYIYCNHYRKYSKYKLCTPHSMNYDKLEKEIVEFLKLISEKYLKSLNYQKCISENKKNYQSYADKLLIKIGNLNIQVKKLDQKILQVYSDKLDGIITPDTFTKMTSQLEIDKKTSLDNLKEINDIYIEYKSNNNIDEEKQNKKIIKKFLEQNIVTRDDVRKIIEKIEISQEKDVDVHFKIKALNYI